MDGTLKLARSEFRIGCEGGRTSESNHDDWDQKVRIKNSQKIIFMHSVRLHAAMKMGFWEFLCFSSNSAIQIFSPCGTVVVHVCFVWSRPSSLNCVVPSFVGKMKCQWRSKRGRLALAWRWGRTVVTGEVTGWCLGWLQYDCDQNAPFAPFSECCFSTPVERMSGWWMIVPECPRLSTHLILSLS